MKAALVTGASRGIGREIAQALGRAGWCVAVQYHENRQMAEETAQNIGTYQAIAVGADMSDPVQASGAVVAAVERFGRMDLLVNNAGVAQQKLFTEITEADWDRIFDTNVKGAFFCAQAAARHMIARKSGVILNISSIWGMAGAAMEAHYSASKAAIIGLTKALAKELGPSGIRVNCIAPGVIDTDMNRTLPRSALDALAEETPLGCIGTCADVAELAVFLASESAQFITGQIISPNGGLII